MEEVKLESRELPTADPAEGKARMAIDGEFVPGRLRWQRAKTPRALPIMIRCFPSAGRRLEHFLRLGSAISHDRHDRTAPGVDLQKFARQSKSSCVFATKPFFRAEAIRRSITGVVSRGSKELRTICLRQWPLPSRSHPKPGRSSTG